jgi:RNA polymerase sigma-70 factor (ECF subfamily)
VTIPAASSQVTDVEAAAFFRKVFDAEYDYVFHSLRRLGVHERDLEDLTHDVFVAVYQNLERYDRTRPIRPWLFAFAFRLASDYRRLARHKTHLGIVDEVVPASGPTAEDEASRREASRMVADILDAMPTEQRAVFVLYEIDETPMKEIAESLDIPLNTAYSRLRLAREIYRAEVEKWKGGAR